MKAIPSAWKPDGKARPMICEKAIALAQWVMQASSMHHHAYARQSNRM